MAALSEPLPPPPFAGFAPAALAFLRELAERQDKVWFAEHKADYEREVREPMERLATDLRARLPGAGLPFRGDPRRALFRVHRDTRFSADKRPYKTHIGAALTRDGDKNTPGVIYVHVDPEGSFMAAGFFRPDADALHRIRTAIQAQPAAWGKLVKALAKADLSLSRDDSLVRPPKGFEAATQATAPDIRLKSWIVRRDIAPTALNDAGLLDLILDFAGSAAPLLRFGWNALGQR